MGTDFELQLRRAGHETIVVGGFMANKCVEATVRVAADLGFAVWVLADGTATVGQSDRRGCSWEADDVHNLALAGLQAEHTHVIDIGELLTRVPSAAA